MTDATSLYMNDPYGYLKHTTFCPVCRGPCRHPAECVGPKSETHFARFGGRDPFDWQNFPVRSGHPPYSHGLGGKGYPYEHRGRRLTRDIKGSAGRSLSRASKISYTLERDDRYSKAKKGKRSKTAPSRGRREKSFDRRKPEHRINEPSKGCFPPPKPAHHIKKPSKCCFPLPRKSISRPPNGSYPLTPAVLHSIRPGSEKPRPVYYVDYPRDYKYDPRYNKYDPWYLGGRSWTDYPEYYADCSRYPRGHSREYYPGYYTNY